MSPRRPRKGIAASDAASVAAYTGIPGAQRIVSFAGAKENGVTRFWAVTSDAADVYAGTQGWDHDGYAGAYRLDVGQSAWTSITSGLANGVTPFFVSAARNDVDTVFVAGGSDVSRPTVFRSTAGGGNWQSVLQTVNNANVQTGWSGDGGVRGWSYGETALGFSVSPLDSSRMMITDFGFAHYSEDSGATWRALLHHAKRGRVRALALLTGHGSRPILMTSKTITVPALSSWAVFVRGAVRVPACIHVEWHWMCVSFVAA
jgi:hypothetical protein